MLIDEHGAHTTELIEWTPERRKSDPTAAAYTSNSQHAQRIRDDQPMQAGSETTRLLSKTPARLSKTDLLVLLESNGKGRRQQYSPTSNITPTSPTHNSHKNTHYFGFTLPVWSLFLFTFVMYGAFIPFTNWSSVILIRFYFNRPNPSEAYIVYREIAAAR